MTAKHESASLKEGLALRLRDIANQNDLGIDSDSDETLKSDSPQNNQTDTNQSELSDRRNSTNFSDSALSSNQTSLASSVTTEKAPGVWLLVNDENTTVDDAGLKSPDDRRQSYRRASSLKSSRAVDEGPSSSQKKAVRFADALGLDLTAVKQLMDSDFANPPTWCQPKADVLTRKVLRPVFEQPSSRYGTSFRQHVVDSKVCLENLLINELTMIGSIRVANISFEKRVFVRYSTDCWIHCADKEATYVALSCDGSTDRFSFTITAPADINPYGLAEFSVCYVANGTEYWDSNDGRNYVCEVMMEELASPYNGDLND